MMMKMMKTRRSRSSGRRRRLVGTSTSTWKSGLLPLVLSSCYSLVVVAAATTPNQGGGDVDVAGIHLPIYQRPRSIPISEKNGEGKGKERRGASASLGLGDYQDVTYTVLVSIGGTSTPLVLDTGSSDLWVLSDLCTTCLRFVPFYPASSSGFSHFKSSGLVANLLYGDSRTGTHAAGLIGEDRVELAGVGLDAQWFVAIGDTNTTIEEAGGAGIFGVGFPYNSVVWSKIFTYEHQTGTKVGRRNSQEEEEEGRGVDLRRFDFPHLSLDWTKDTPLAGNTASTSHRRDVLATPSQTQAFLADVFASYTRTAPLLCRLAATSNLLKPQFTVTLQRDSVDIGGNVGMLSVGTFPEGVKEDDMTWVPVRTYTSEQGGLPSPVDRHEEYPITWEVFIEDVFFDGVKLPKSNLTTSIVPSALIDTGNSLIRGPSDVISFIHTLISSSSPSGTPVPGSLRSNTLFSCSQPHNLTFQIGGRLFPVDPRDFVSQAYRDSVDACVPNLAPTDPPREGSYLYSWSLGAPFLKGVLTTFHYGNLTHPSSDPPKIGFLSTVPGSAGEGLQNAVKQAQDKNGGNFRVSSEAAPSGTRTGAVRTNAQGVPIVGPTGKSGAARSAGLGVGVAHICGLVVVVWLWVGEVW